MTRAVASRRGGAIDARGRLASRAGVSVFTSDDPSYVLVESRLVGMLPRRHDPATPARRRFAARAMSSAPEREGHPGARAFAPRARALGRRARRLASATMTTMTTMTTERATGLAVPRAQTFDGAALTLAGVGARVKKICGLGVKVYACGFYVDAAGVREAMGDGETDALEALKTCERSIRLKFARDVGGDKIVEALAERIRPAMDADSTSLKRFEAIFDGVSFKKGTSLDFTATADGALATRIKGKKVSHIADRALVDALFAAYVGADPVIPSLKSAVREFIENLR